MSTAFDEHPYPNKSVFMSGRPEWVLGPPDASHLTRRRRSSPGDYPSVNQRSHSYERSRSRPRLGSYSEEEKRAMALTPRRPSFNTGKNDAWALDRHRPPPPRYRSHRSSSSDSRSSASDSDSDSDRGRTRHRNNQRMLVTGMAVVTSLAAANNVYQSHQARQDRRRKLKEGGLGREEHMMHKKKHLMKDAIALGVAGVCLNNARKGWERVRKLED